MFRPFAFAAKSIVYKRESRKLLKKIISPVLFGINRSFKRLDTISLKAGVFIRVSEMRRLHYKQFYQVVLSFCLVAGVDKSATLMNFCCYPIETSTLKIVPSLFSIRRSFKRQNIISLKTGVSNNVYVMRRLHLLSQCFSARESSVKRLPTQINSVLQSVAAKTSPVLFDINRFFSNGTIHSLADRIFVARQ